MLRESKCELTIPRPLRVWLGKFALTSSMVLPLLMIGCSTNLQQERYIENAQIFERNVERRLRLEGVRFAIDKSVLQVERPSTFHREWNIKDYVSKMTRSSVVPESQADAILTMRYTDTRDQLRPGYLIGRLYLILSVGPAVPRRNDIAVTLFEVSEDYTCYPGVRPSDPKNCDYKRGVAMFKAFRRMGIGL